jgi:hypothetical protein
MKTFWTFFWVLWLAMLVIGDPIALWFGDRSHLGDGYTDTHLLVTHIGMGLRVAIIAWLVYHFLVAHRTA